MYYIHPQMSTQGAPQTPIETKAGPQVFSPTVQVMEHMVSGGKTNEEDANTAYTAIAKGNRAKVYSLVNGQSISTECYMQYKPGGTLGFLQFICSGYVLYI